MAAVVAAASPSRATMPTAARRRRSRVAAPAVDGAGGGVMGPRRPLARRLSSWGNASSSCFPCAPRIRDNRPMSEARFLGVDFSGGAGPWKAVCSRPTVWIATLEAFRLTDLRPVQELEGEDEPFERLAGLLREGRYRAAGIDAP